MFRPDLWVNATDLFHATALMYAAQQEEGEESVKLLLGEQLHNYIFCREMVNTIMH